MSDLSGTQDTEPSKRMLVRGGVPLQAPGKSVNDANRHSESTPNRLERLIALSQSADITIRQRLAANRTTPAEVLARLSEDADEQIRLLVAKNPSSPHHVVAKLARDSAASVRLGLATDHHCPVEILSVLADDEDSAVRETARETRRALLPKYQHIFNVAFS